MIEQSPLPDGLWPAHAADATRIVFRGTGYDGSGRAAGGSVFLPFGSPPPGGWPVISYATGLAPGLTVPERVHVARWLTAGYAVTVADHHGNGPHSYLNGEAVADDVVDIVRAARRADSHVGRTWLVVGFSRGAHAALFTGLVASQYAPELDFRGTVAIAPPVHPTLLAAELTADGGSGVSPLIPFLLAGVGAEFLTPTGRVLVALAAEGTFDEVAEAAWHVTNDDAGFTGLHRRTGVMAVLDACRVPVSRMDRPVLLTGGDDDDVVPADVVAQYYQQMRQTGVDVRFARHDTTHLGLLRAGLDDIVAWARRPGFGRRDGDRDGRLTGDDFAVCALRLVQACGEPPGSPAAQAVRRGYAALWREVSARSGATVELREFLHWLDAGQADGFEAAVHVLAEAVLHLARKSDSVTAAEIAAAVRDPGRTDDWLFGQL
ncbi:lipase family protein [Actinophytocola algeriensis]|uniref:Dienelactone hydrolase n=1 Tax=Actinophytocola algeriensis TaxID=1768010 RepID=A0A7W7Q5S3_9PSEU|nr:lipase family protein [Actinophytocola algeriensis]MBB4907494.1 dienelactone hydrolase [Actinophytocola algeriensis]MBE1479524.1 putative esterase [Actinophytocola algeriensis]